MNPPHPSDSRLDPNLYSAKPRLNHSACSSSKFQRSERQTAEHGSSPLLTRPATKHPAARKPQTQNAFSVRRTQRERDYLFMQYSTTPVVRWIIGNYNHQREPMKDEMKSPSHIYVLQTTRPQQSQQKRPSGASPTSSNIGNPTYTSSLTITIP